jgi:hypothetical protein
MRPLLATVAVAMIQSAALVFGEPFQFGSCASPQTAQNTAPSEPAPSPNQPSVVIPTEQRHRCKFTLQINGRAILVTVPVSELISTIRSGPLRCLHLAHQFPVSCSVIALR